MKQLMVLVAVLAAAVGCNKTKVESPVVQGTVAIQLGSGIEEVTAGKAAYSGDVAVADLQFLRKDGMTTPTDFSGQLPFVGSRAVGGAITFSSTQYYADNNTDHAYFASYFPAGTLVGGVVTWTIDGKTDVMATGVVDAGTGGTPTSASLIYAHQLAQVEVICQAKNAPATDIQTYWGKINQLYVKSTPIAMTLNLATLRSAAAATVGDLVMVGADYQTEFAPIDVPGNTNTTVNAVAMIVPSTARTFVLRVVTENQGSKDIAIDLGEGNMLAHSKKHVVTLIFHPQGSEIEIAVQSSIEAWTPGATGSGNLIIE